jgi:superoxide dismutase, Cu-Zn family
MCRKNVAAFRDFVAECFRSASRRLERNSWCGQAPPTEMYSCAMMRSFTVPFFSLLVACGGNDPGYEIPVTLTPAAGQTVTGTGAFQRAETGVVTFGISFADAPEGMHGIHIHELDNCGDNGTAAGGHWNPDSVEHGTAGAGHLGDMGNVTIRADGTAEFSFSNPKWTAGDGADTDVEGRSVILHELVDDFGQPTGNAGARIGCAVIPHLAG